MRANPQVAEAHHLHLGLLLARAGQTEQGLAAFRQASNLAPGNAAARVTLVRALSLGGGYAEAWAEVERALPRGDRYPLTC